MFLDYLPLALALHCLASGFRRAEAGSGSRQWFTERALEPLVSYRTDVVRCGTTVAELGYTAAGHLEACRLSETTDDGEMRWLVKRLTDSPRQTDIVEMLDLIERCGRLEGSHVLNNVTHFHTYPGTLWCGPGDSASSYFELGPNAAVDRCCRDHDLCPVRASPGEISVPIIWSQDSAGSSMNLFTVSHCRCDAAFKRCLHEAGTTEHITAKALIFLYEMVIRQCLGDSGQLVTQRVDFWDLFR